MIPSKKDSWRAWEPMLVMMAQTRQELETSLGIGLAKWLGRRKIMDGRDILFLYMKNENNILDREHNLVEQFCVN
jgi:hypothetical protein